MRRGPSGGTGLESLWENVWECTVGGGADGRPQVQALASLTHSLLVLSLVRLGGRDGGGRRGRGMELVTETGSGHWSGKGQCKHGN